MTKGENGSVYITRLQLRFAQCFSQQKLPAAVALGRSSGGILSLTWKHRRLWCSSPSWNTPAKMTMNGKG